MRVPIYANIIAMCCFILIRYEENFSMLEHVLVLKCSSFLQAGGEMGDHVDLILRLGKKRAALISFIDFQTTKRHGCVFWNRKVRGFCDNGFHAGVTNFLTLALYFFVSCTAQTDSETHVESLFRTG